MAAGSSSDSSINFDLRHAVMCAGEVCYLVGLARNQCPAFNEADMRVSWRVGWQRAHDAHFRHDKRAALQCHPGCQGRHP